MPLTATATPNMPGATGAGQAGFVAPDGTRIVVQLDRHDTAADGVATHAALGVTVWTVDATGRMTGSPLARWVHSVPFDVLAVGTTTLAALADKLRGEAVDRLLTRRAVESQFAAMALAPPPVPAPTLPPVTPRTP